MSVLGALLKKDDAFIIKHLCYDINLRKYLYDQLKSNPSLTHYRTFDFSSGTDRLNPYPFDCITDDLIHEELSLVEENCVVISRLKTAILVSACMSPSLWSYTDDHGWTPAAIDVEDADKEQLFYLGRFYNMHSNKWQEAYADYDYWLHVEPKGEWGY